MKKYTTCVNVYGNERKYFSSIEDAIKRAKELLEMFPSTKNYGIFTCRKCGKFHLTKDSKGKKNLIVTREP